jgi:hypothetical protein
MGSCTVRVRVMRPACRAGGRRLIAIAVSVAITVGLCGPSGWSRSSPANVTSQPLTAGKPVYDLRAHDIGEVMPLITTYDGIGLFEFPRGSRIGYIYGAKLLFGCVRTLDTLVSEGGQFPVLGENTWDMNSYQPIVATSTLRNRPAYSPEAVAEQQFYVVYSDTALPPSGSCPGGCLDAIEQRKHKPIGIEVHQTSYAWSTGYAKRFVIIDSWIKNISERPIADGCVGLGLISNVNWLPEAISFHTWPPVTNLPIYSDDDLCGFLGVVPGIAEGFTDTVNTVWLADNDGDPVGTRAFSNVSPTGVMGVRVLRAPPDTRLSFNWWVNEWGGNGYTINWGPRQQQNRLGYYGSRGIPFGDRARYKMMLNREIDYDMAYAASEWPAHEGWSQDLPEALAPRVADGHRVNYILSVGPIPPIPPGDSVPFTLALIGGANFHLDPGNFQKNFSPSNPKPFLDRLDFADLITNARWADWVFDNPGYDTDGDGNRGRAYPVNCRGGRCDSIFYKGDGVPDFRGPHPPFPPDVELTSKPSKVILQWDGAFTELQVDPLSGRRDFEGYRVYAGRFDRDDRFSLIASWDREDFARFSYDREIEEWVQISDPLAIADWQLILSDPQFDPADYSRPSLESAYRDTVVDTVRNQLGEIIRITEAERYSYWKAEDYNRENEYWDMGRSQRNLIQRLKERDTTIADEQLTYGVYEITIDHLNPSVPLYFAVTAFDFGDYKVGIEALESAPSNNSQYAQPIYSSQVVLDSGLGVSVYPNPYKTSYLDASGHRTTYYLEGFEGRGIVDFTEQDRRIHFINLPDTATISIYSLDGDLIRRIHHPDPFLTTYSSSVGWDLISRNTQAVTSGIYIWKVDSKLGSQTGKLVIIK